MKLPLITELCNGDFDHIEVPSMTINMPIELLPDIHVNFLRVSNIRITCILNNYDDFILTNNTIHFVDIMKTDEATGKDHTVKGFVVLDEDREIIAIYTLEYAIGHYTFIKETNQVLWKESVCIFLYDVRSNEIFSLH